MPTWILREIESVAEGDWNGYPVRSSKDRCSLVRGDLIKLIFEIRDGDNLPDLYRRWVTVDSGSHDAESTPRYVGNLNKGGSSPGGRFPPDGAWLGSVPKLMR